MTAIAVRVYPETIALACDSLQVADTRKDRAVCKLFESANLIWTFAGDVDSGMMLLDRLHKLPDVNAEAIRAWLLECRKELSDYLDKDSDVDGLLVGQGRCYEISGLYVREVDDYAAIGSGAEYCLAILDQGGTPAEAVQAAIRRDIYSGEPIFCIEVERDTDRETGSTNPTAPAARPGGEKEADTDRG